QPRGNGFQFLNENHAPEGSPAIAAWVGWIVNSISWICEKPNSDRRRKVTCTAARRVNRPVPCPGEIVLNLPTSTANAITINRASDDRHCQCCEDQHDEDYDHHFDESKSVDWPLRMPERSHFTDLRWRSGWLYCRTTLLRSSVP